MKGFIGKLKQFDLCNLLTFRSLDTFRYIEIAWAFSTLIGLVLFLVEIAILCWVKFYDLSQAAAWSACIVLIPVIIIFLGKLRPDCK